MTDRLSGDALNRLLGGFPGADRLSTYLQGRARRELGKLSEEQLRGYLDLLTGLMTAVKTGENLNAYLEAADDAEERREVAV